jgi:DNA-binding SARP family transcriptional activator
LNDLAESAADAPRLCLALLGRPEVSAGGRRLRFRSPRALALLAYLAVEACPVPDWQQAALLWPGTTAAQAGKALRQAQATLRRALGDGALVEGRETLAIVPAAIAEFDYQAFLTALDAPMSGVNPVTPETRRRRLVLLTSVLSLYRGDFLEGFGVPDAPAFEAWLHQRRAECRRCYAELKERVREAEGELLTAARS